MVELFKKEKLPVKNPSLKWFIVHVQKYFFLIQRSLYTDYDSKISLSNNATDYDSKISLSNNA